MSDVEWAKKSGECTSQTQSAEPTDNSAESARGGNAGIVLTTGVQD